MPLGFMAREEALALFWMLQGSRQYLWPLSSHGGLSAQTQQHSVSGQTGRKRCLWFYPLHHTGSAVGLIQLGLKLPRLEVAPCGKALVKLWHCCPMANSWELQSKVSNSMSWSPAHFWQGFSCPAQSQAHEPGLPENQSAVASSQGWAGGPCKDRSALGVSPDSGGRAAPQGKNLTP